MQELFKIINDLYYHFQKFLISYFMYTNLTIITLIQMKFKIMNPKIKSNNIFGRYRYISCGYLWALSNSKWFSNYNLNRLVEIDLPETKIKFLAGNDWHPTELGLINGTL